MTSLFILSGEIRIFCLFSVMNKWRPMWVKTFIVNKIVTCLTFAFTFELKVGLVDIWSTSHSSLAELALMKGITGFRDMVIAQ